jgi:cell fate regulator YaaT (PSP1 superfamily)
MCEVIGIRFRSCGKITFYDPGNLELKKDDWAVVEGDMGLTLGCVVLDRNKVDAPDKSFKKIIRIASEEDFKQKHENDILVHDATDFCIKRIQHRALPMKFIEAEATLDRRRIIFYFTAEGRIDFRKLVRDLASRFKTRIEMRQIGVRDEVKFLGGIGACGREVCCKLFLFNFEPISIKMAKKQELVLSPSKLSGLCGRLRCCIAYEDAASRCCGCEIISNESYQEADDIFEINVDAEIPFHRHGRDKRRDCRRPKKQKKRE